jgi:hypothetical protein
MRILVNGDNDRIVAKRRPLPKVKKKNKEERKKETCMGDARGSKCRKKKGMSQKTVSCFPPPFSFPSTRLLPSFPPLLTRPINFRVHNAHMPCKRIIPRKGFLFSTEMTTDLLLAGIVYCIFVTS